MIPRTTARAGVPSREALRILRRLALTGSTLGVIGGACAVGAINYEIQRRIQVAEQLVESKRSLHSACPKYDRSARHSTLAKMQQAAEAGEFEGLQSFKANSEPTGQPTVSAQGTDVPDAGSQTNGRTVPTSEPPDGLSQLQSSTSSTSEQGPGQLRVDEIGSPFLRTAESSTQFSNFNFHTRPHTGSKDGVASSRALLDAGKPIEAAHHFLDETYPFEYSKAHNALAFDLLYANVKQGRTSVAVRIFRRINTYGTVTPALWRAIMRPLGKAKSWETLSEIYCRYASDFEVQDQTLRNTIMNGLIFNNRFQSAKEMILQYLDRDPEGWLCATYLEGLRKYSRSVELVESEFKRLLKTLSQRGMVVSERLFHPLLRTYVNFGYDEKAQRLLQEMQTVYEMGPSVKILGIFASRKAVKSDWEGVEELFKEMATLGGRPGNVQAFRRHFDRIFLEYFLSHSGQEIRDFVFRAIDDYGLLPDELLFQHILMAYIQKGTRDMVIELVEIAEKRLWQINFDTQYFLDCLRTQRIACEKGSGGLWPMFQAAQQKYGRVATSNRVLGFDKSSFPNLDVFKAPYTGEDTRASLQAESVSEITRPINNYAPLVRRMVVNLNVGKYHRVLNFYRDAKRAGKVLNRKHVKLVAVASIFHYTSWKDHGSMNTALQKAQSMILSERDIFLDYDESVTPPLFRTILESSPGLGATHTDRDLFLFLKRALFLFYITLEELKLPIKHDMLTSLSLRTQLAGRPRKALALIRKVNQSKYGARAFFDVSGLRLIARCCALCGNLRGVRWAILSGRKRMPDGIGDLADEIDVIIERLRISKTSLLAEEQGTFKQEVESLRALSRSFRLDIAARTGRSSEPKPDQPGLEDKEEKPMQNTREESEAHEETSNDGQPLDESLSPPYTEETLADWDERVELEKVLAPRSNEKLCALAPSYPKFELDELNPATTRETAAAARSA